MAYMRDRTGRRLDSFKVAGPELRQRDLPPLRNPNPKTAAVLPTVSIATGNSTITGSIELRGTSRGFFTVFDTRIVQDGNGDLVSIRGPWAIEWQADSPLFDIHTIRSGTSATFSLLVDGDLAVPPTWVGGSDGSRTRIYVDWGGVRKMRHYRLEMSSNFKFHGIDVLPSDSVNSADWEPATVVWGDSFTEPTIIDNTANLVVTGHEGWANVMGRALGLRHLFPSGSGGTGLLNPGANGRVKLRDRVDADIPLNPPRWFVAMGINDANREASTPSYTAQMEYDEAMLLFAYLKTQLPYSQGGVFSPWHSRNDPGASAFAFRDALKAAAAANGLPFYDVLALAPASRRVSGTFSTAASGTSITATVPFNNGDYIQVGTPAWTTTPGTVDVRQVNGRSGTGPYTHTLSSALSTTWPIGTAVTNGGRAWSYGTGNQAAPSGNGPADFLIGNDNTHPTVAGHLRAGMVAAELVRGTMDF